MDEDGNHTPTHEDARTYVAGCWYDILDDSTIEDEDKKAFELAMLQHLYNFIDFINKK